MEDLIPNPTFFFLHSPIKKSINYIKKSIELYSLYLSMKRLQNNLIFIGSHLVKIFEQFSLGVSLGNIYLFIYLFIIIIIIIIIFNFMR
jgi:hypothetical protein